MTETTPELDNTTICNNSNKCLENLGTPNSLEPYVTEQEAASFLFCKINTLKRWRAENRGPAYYKAGGIKYLKSDLVLWVASTQVIPGS